MVGWVVGSILHGVDPLSYFSFQPELHDWCNKGRGMYSLVACRQCRLPPPSLLPFPFFPLSRTEEPAKVGTCARDRRALQQLALNVHVKHSDLLVLVPASGVTKAVVCVILSAGWCI